MTSSKNAAHAVGGKTARACDSCIRKRARWYCAADDAFLCQSCDSLVHSANPLARRHERLRLKTASFKSSSASSDAVFVLPAVDLTLAPSWHRGITKKPRTPRHGKNQASSANQTPRGRDEPARNPFHLVPEVGSDEYSVNSHDENEEQLLYRVPIFDPFVTELCTPPSSVTSAEAATAATPGGPNKTDDNKVSSENKTNNNGVDNLHGFLPSEMELAQFAADVESLLGRGLENECIGMEDLGLIDSKEKESRDCCVMMGSEKVKMEDDEESPYCKVETADEIEIGIREPFELNFDYDDSPATREQTDNDDNDNDDEKKVEMRSNEGDEVKANSNNQRKKRILLQLNYEAVLSAWSSQKSPWTTGGKPEFDADECWPECMGTCGMELHQPYYGGEVGTYGGCQAAMGDGGREARVTRYREKRRTRLFSKKIRYEVRKLNAEKRPRMKGRFVKRASFAVAATTTTPQPPSSSSACPLLSR